MIIAGVYFLLTAERERLEGNILQKNNPTFLDKSKINRLQKKTKNNDTTLNES